MDYLSLIGRNELLFERDLSSYNDELVSLVSKARFLVIGGAGSISRLLRLTVVRLSLKRL